MNDRYHISNLGRFGAGITTDLAGYVHTTAEGWLSAPMDAADGPMTRGQAHELAKEARAATAAAEAAVTAWQGGRSSLTWHQMPDDAGQSVDVEYAVEWVGGGEGWLYRRGHDRSDGVCTVERAAIDGGEFAPWNGTLPEHGEWQDVG